MNEYSCSFTLNHPMTQEDFDKIIDAELDSTPTMTFRTKSGKEVEYAKVVRCKDCTKWDKSTMRHYEDVIFGSGDTAECRMFCDMDTWGEFTDDMRRTDGNWFCADGERKEDA